MRPPHEYCIITNEYPMQVFWAEPLPTAWQSLNSAQCSSMNAPGVCFVVVEDWDHKAEPLEPPQPKQIVAMFFNGEEISDDVERVGVVTEKLDFLKYNDRGN